MALGTSTQASSRFVDCHVGVRIRSRRRDLGVSQEALAEALGLTFQQIQKYERGSNRVSASTLWEIAARLRTPIAYFFEGLETGEHDGAAIARAEAVHAFLLTPEGIDLALAFYDLDEPATRRAVLDLIRACGRARGNKGHDRENGVDPSLAPPSAGVDCDAGIAAPEPVRARAFALRP